MKQYYLKTTRCSPKNTFHLKFSFGLKTRIWGLEVEVTEGASRF